MPANQPSPSAPQGPDPASETAAAASSGSNAAQASAQGPPPEMPHITSRSIYSTTQIALTSPRSRRRRTPDRASSPIPRPGTADQPQTPPGGTGNPRAAQVTRAGNAPADQRGTASGNTAILHHAGPAIGSANGPLHVSTPPQATARGQRRAFFLPVNRESILGNASVKGMHADITPVDRSLRDRGLRLQSSPSPHGASMQSGESLAVPVPVPVRSRSCLSARRPSAA